MAAGDGRARLGKRRAAVLHRRAGQRRAGRRGHLAITVRRADPGLAAARYDGCRYTSARLITKGLKPVRYGLIEASIKIPGGRGIWPAFWLLGTDIGHVGWPACGEIDVMENFGTAPACVYGTVHGPGYCGDSGIGGELAVGGTASVAPDRSTSFPQTMLVDYVRVHAA